MVLLHQQPARKTAFGEKMLLPLLYEFLFPSAHLLEIHRSEPLKKLEEQFPRCSSSSTRVCALGLITELSTHCFGNLKTVVKALSNLHYFEPQQLDGEMEFDSLPLIIPRKSQGLSGLKNPCATCYMNSVLQQLYMQPHVRHGLLSVATTEEAEKTDSVLYQVQSSFAHMLMGLAQHYAPEGFWKSYRHYGEPVSVREQQDAREFFDNLVDQLDGHLARRGYPRLLSAVFGGVITDVKKIKSGCDHVYERDEIFITLSLDIRNQTNLRCSLDQLISAELLEEYNCDKCSEKRQCIKRGLFKTLPNVLVFQLKRFDYDWERQMPIKFNDLFEFPATLDMAPYTLDFARDGSGPPQMYRLSGVLVHSGQASGGHYYSFVRAPTGQGWLKFDDTEVSEVSVVDERGEWFGGEYTQNVWDAQLKMTVPKRRERWWNAYMLFYERVEPQPLKLECEQALDLTASNPPEDVVHTVDQHNLEFRHHQELYCTEYFKFTLDLCSASTTYGCPVSGNDCPIGVCTMMAMRFLPQFAMRADRSLRPPFTEWLDLLSKAMGRCSHSREIVARLCLSQSAFRIFLLECPTPEVRQFFEQLTLKLIAETVTQDRPEMQTQHANAICTNVLHSMHKDLYGNIKHSLHFFRFCNALIQQFPSIGTVLLANHFLKVTLETVFAAIQSKSLYETAAFNSLLLCVVLRTDWRFAELGGQNDVSLPHPPNPFSIGPSLYQSQDACIMAQSEYFSNVVLMSPLAPETVQAMLCLCWSSEFFSKKFIGEIIPLFYRNGHMHHPVYYGLLLRIVELQDMPQMQELRWKWLFSAQANYSLVPVMQQHRRKKPKRCYLALKFLLHCFRTFPLAREILLAQETVQQWCSFLPWLQVTLQRLPASVAHSNETVATVHLERSPSAMSLLASVESDDVLMQILNEVVSHPEYLSDSDPDDQTAPRQNTS